MLTRRDQRKLKEEKALAKKEAKGKAEGKKSKGKLEKDDDDDTVKPRSSRSRAAKARASADGPGEEEVPEPAKPKKEAKLKDKVKAKGKTRASCDQMDDEDNQDDACPTDNTEEKTVKPKQSAPKRAPKSKAEPKSKARAKAKPKAKAKAAAEKVSAKTKVAKNKTKIAEEQEEEEEEISTPKKRLFEEDAESEDHGEGDHEGEDESLEIPDSSHDRLDRKSGKVKPLKEIFEDEVPNTWKATRPKKAQKTCHAASAASREVEEEEADKPKRKSRAQPKKPAKRKQELSPFTKKEKNRRQKKEKENMQSTPSEDLTVQGIFLQHLKCTSKLTPSDVKKYLYQNVEHKFWFGKINPYFTRATCGVQYQLDDKSTKLSEMVYFGNTTRALPDFQAQNVMAYVTGSLMVSWLSFSKMFFTAFPSWLHLNDLTVWSNLAEIIYHQYSMTYDLMIWYPPTPADARGSALGNNTFDSCFGLQN